MHNTLHVDTKAKVVAEHGVSRLQRQFKRSKVTKDEVIQPLNVDHWQAPLHCLLVLLTAWPTNKYETSKARQKRGSYTGLLDERRSGTVFPLESRKRTYTYILTYNFGRSLLLTVITPKHLTFWTLSTSFPWALTETLVGVQTSEGQKKLASRYL